MPWALTKEPPELEPEDAYEKGYAEGWNERLKRQGWK
jgi:hypothetical protein